MADDVYVDGELSGSGDTGVDWDNAHEGLAGLQDALDAVVDGNQTNMYIRNMTSQTVTAAIEVDAGGGSIAGNTWLDLIFCDSEGNEHPMGTREELDAEDNDLGKAILWINGIENVRVWHCHAKDNHNGADNTDHGIEVKNTAAKYNFVFIDCEASGCYDGFKFSDTSDTKCIMLFRCSSHDNTYYSVVDASFIGSLYVDCYFKGSGTNGGVLHTYSAIFVNCIFEGGYYGNYHSSAYPDLMYGCTFINHTVSNIVQVGSSIAAACAIINCVGTVAVPASDAFVRIVTGDGSCLYCDYCITDSENFTAAGGNPLVPGNAAGNNSQDSVTITFADADNKDFTMVSDTLREAGSPDYLLNPRSIGAIAAIRRSKGSHRMMTQGNMLGVL